MHIALLIFLLVLCALAIAFLVLVMVNAIKRVCESHPQQEDTGGAKTKKVVDLFVARHSELPRYTMSDRTNFGALVVPGMTALVDLGMYNLETGIYMLQGNSAWVKIGVPDVGDQFLILRGEHARKQHTIRPSFVQEVRPPSETQVVHAANAMQILLETTAKVFVQTDVVGAVQVTVNQTRTHHAHNSMSSGRLLMVVNASPTYPCVLVFKPFADNITVPPASILYVQLQLKSNVQGSFFYEAIALSSN